MQNTDEMQDLKAKVNHASIYEALAQVTREITAISKDRQNEQQRFKYRGIEDFLNQVHALYARHGILVFTDVLDTCETERTTKNNTLMFYPKATVKFTWVHEGGSSHTATVVGSAMDSGDKGLNKCYSIAYKYALMFLHNVPTIDIIDPDGTTPDPLKGSQQNTPPQQQRQPRNGSTPPPQQPAEKKTVGPRGSDSYKIALEWLRKNTEKNTLSRLQQTYNVDAKTLADLAIDAKLPIGGGDPSSKQNSNEKETKNEQQPSSSVS